MEAKVSSLIIVPYNILHPLSPQHMHESVELKQQLQKEHEQALVALHTKQKEINQLQKVRTCDKNRRLVI